MWLDVPVWVQGLIVPETKTLGAQSLADKHFYRRKGLKHAAETLVAYQSVKGAQDFSLLVSTYRPCIRPETSAQGAQRSAVAATYGHVCTGSNASSELYAIAGAQYFAVAGARRIADGSR